MADVHREHLMLVVDNGDTVHFGKHIALTSQTETSSSAPLLQEPGVGSNLRVLAERWDHAAVASLLTIDPLAKNNLVRK